MIINGNKSRIGHRSRSATNENEVRGTQKKRRTLFFLKKRTFLGGNKRTNEPMGCVAFKPGLEGERNAPDLRDARSHRGLNGRLMPHLKDRNVKKRKKREMQQKRKKRAKEKGQISVSSCYCGTDDSLPRLFELKKNWMFQSTFFSSSPKLNKKNLVIFERKLSRLTSFFF